MKIYINGVELAADTNKDCVFFVWDTDKERVGHAKLIANMEPIGGIRMFAQFPDDKVEFVKKIIDEIAAAYDGLPYLAERLEVVNKKHAFYSPEEMKEAIAKYFADVDNSEPELIHGAMVKKPYSREGLMDSLGISQDTLYFHVDGKTEYGVLLRDALKVIHESRLNWINEIHELKRQR